MSRFIALLLCMNIVCSAASLEQAPVAPDECVLARSLSQWLEIKVVVEGQNLRFIGQKAKLAGAIAKLRDFDQVRKEFLSINPNASEIRSVAKPLESWEECFTVLGINPASVRLFNIQGTKDNAGKQLMIPAGDDFNGSVADLYVKALIKNSIFFKWVADNFKEQFIEKVDSDEGALLAIHYGLLNQFLCLGNIEISEEKEGKDDGDDGDDVQVKSSDCVIPKQALLKNLVAAGSGSINLERTGANEYGIRFVSLGEGTGSSYPTVEFVLDTSYSMRPEIEAINRTIPQLLEKLSYAFPRTRVRIFSFNDAKNLEAEFDLLQGQQVPAFRPLAVSGGTNLGHIASSIPLRDGESSKAVVAFTDGDHASQEKLDNAIEALKLAQQRGRFALPRLFRVGAGSAGSGKFFGDMSSIFAGSSALSGSIDDFCATLLSDIADISRPKTSLSLQRAGTVRVNWVPIDRPGLFRTGVTVREGDSIVDRHGSHVISLPADAAAEQMVAPVLDAKSAKRAERERLLAALAALGDDD